MGWAGNLSDKGRFSDSFRLEIHMASPSFVLFLHFLSLQWSNATVLCAEQNRITTSLSDNTRLEALSICLIKIGITLLEIFIEIYFFTV